jgi:hypothetical protein
MKLSAILSNIKTKERNDFEDCKNDYQGTTPIFKVWFFTSQPMTDWYARIDS